MFMNAELAIKKFLNILRHIIIRNIVRKVGNRVRADHINWQNIRGDNYWNGMKCVIKKKGSPRSRF